MKLLPFDPTPYVGMYAFVVFLCPWFIYAYCVIRECLYIRRNYPEYLSVCSIKAYKEKRKIRRGDANWWDIHRIAMKWLCITAVFWITGFSVLALGLYWLESHDLINTCSKVTYR
jgi:hypothetical protein